jgi:hypothetical protein
MGGMGGGNATSGPVTLATLAASDATAATTILTLSR